MPRSGTLKSALALAALLGAAVASLASFEEVSRDWRVPARVDFGALSFPTGAPPYRRRLAAALSPEAAAANPLPLPLSFALSLCPPGDGGALQGCSPPQGAVLVLNLTREGDDGGLTFRSDPTGLMTGVVNLFAACDAGPCMEQLELTLQPESFSAPRIEVTAFSASAEVRLPGDQRPDGGTLRLFEL